PRLVDVPHVGALGLVERSLALSEQELREAEHVGERAADRMRYVADHPVLMLSELLIEELVTHDRMARERRAQRHGLVAEVRHFRLEQGPLEPRALVVRRPFLHGAPRARELPALLVQLRVETVALLDPASALAEELFPLRLELDQLVRPLLDVVS